MKKKNKMTLTQLVNLQKVTKRVKYGSIKTSDIKRLVKIEVKNAIAQAPKLQAKLKAQLKAGNKKQAQNTLKRIEKLKLNQKQKRLIQIATGGYTSKQKSKIKQILKTEGFGAARRQAKRFRQSNKANLVKSLLRSKYGVKYAEREYRKILKATTGETKQKLSKAENRARAKAYLNKLRAREYNARSAQAKEAIRLQRQFMKEKFNAIINAGLSLNLTTSTRHGIAIEEYIDKYFWMKLEELREQYQEQVDSGEITDIPIDQDLYNEVWLDITSSGEVVPLKQGAQYGYYDEEHDEVISPV